MINNYISYSQLVDKGLGEKYLDVALNRYRRGKSTSWENYKDKIVYIKRDTIPARTRKKYGILTTTELEEQKRQRREKVAGLLEDNETATYYVIDRRCLSWTITKTFYTYIKTSYLKWNNAGKRKDTRRLPQHNKAVQRSQGRIRQAI